MKSVLIILSRCLASHWPVGVLIAFIAERAASRMALGAKLHQRRATRAISFVPRGGMWTDVHLGKHLSVSCIVCILAISSFSASWYIDAPGAVTGGLTNGTSWANAWTNPVSIAWTSIAAGDTIYVSGGTTTKSYYQNLYPTSGKSGSAAGGYITISIGQDAGHNGVAIFEGVGVGPGSTSQYFWINGGRNPAFVHPTNHQQVITGPTAITNNTGFWIRNVLGVTQLQDNDPVVWYFTGVPSNLRFSYVEISGLSNTLCGAGCDWKGTVFLASASGSMTNTVFEYLYLHDNVSQQFQTSLQIPNRFDCVTFKFSHIQGGGEDHFEIGGGGWTIRDSVLGETKGYGKIHADMFQFTGRFFKVYNNDIREISHSILRFQTFPDGDVGLCGDFWFFNNLVTEKPGRTADGGLRIEQLGVVHYDPDHPTTNITLTNFVVANNLFFQSTSNLVGTPQLALSPLITFSKGAVTNAFIKDSKWINNIIIDRQSGLNFPATTNATPVGYVPYTTNDLWVDYNVQWATNGNLDQPLNVNYLDTSDMFDASNPYKFSNWTNAVGFVDAPNDNFELSPADTSALNTGFDLSAYFAFDALNRPRSGTWDRGPLEAQSVIFYLSFDNDTSGTNALDSSGNGHHGFRIEHEPNSFPTNRLASSIANTLFRPGISGNAADFQWSTNNSYGLYLEDGGFFAVTNAHSRLTNMSQATIMCWARYQTTRRIDNAYDFSQDGNATLLSASTASGVMGSWDLQRFNESIWINNTRFMVLTGSFAGAMTGLASDRAFGKAGRIVINFPDYGYNNNGDTTNWYHYAVTWDNGVLRSYFNGSAWTTNDVSAVQTKLTLGRNGGVPYAWLGVGVNGHGGTPQLEAEAGEDYPNHGFMNGAIDDVLILDEVWTWQEIVNEANRQGAQFADAPSDGGGGDPGPDLTFARGTPKIRGLRLHR